MAEYRVLRPVEWRREGEHVEIWDAKHARRVVLSAWTAPVLEAIAEEAPLARLAELVPSRASSRRRAQKADARARRLVFGLAQMGNLHIPVEEPPVLIAERYERLRELGRGGVGVAYLYEDRHDARRVVVKRAWDFLQPYATTEDAMRREVAVLRRLDHPGIVRLLDAFEIDGRMHVVREFLDGDDLVRAAGAGWTDDARRRRVGAALADILAHLHARGYLLLDLRPANFLLRADDEPVLIDVGQCRDAPEGHLSFPRAIGSPGFTSPEMEAHARVDTRSDLWGLGRLLHHLARGSAPPRATSEELLASAQGLPERDLLARLLADKPDARPASATDVARTLRDNL